MRRVAREFGLTTMALYRYVDSKDDLYRRDGRRRVRAAAGGQADQAGWRKQLEAWAQRQPRRAAAPPVDRADPGQRSRR